MFRDAGFGRRTALVTSLGCGITNWIFALPAVYTIDTFGRRNLLLTTFPLMCLFLLFTGFSFWIPGLEARTACVATGIYLFMIVYSPGEGPVPFTYSAEAFVSGFGRLPKFHTDSFAAPVCSRYWYVIRNRHYLGFQLYSLPHLASAGQSLHVAGCIWLVCRVELLWVDLLLFLSAGNQSPVIGRA